MVGTAAVAGSAEAVIVTTFENTTVPVPATLHLHQPEKGVTGSSAGTTPGWDFNPYRNGWGLGFYRSPTLAGGLAAAVWCRHL